jgi:hypothetical protein
MMFSRHLFQAVEDMFGVSVAPRYDIYRHLNRFLLLLSRLRKQMLAGSPPLAPAARNTGD